MVMPPPSVNLTGADITPYPSSSMSFEEVSMPLVQKSNICCTDAGHAEPYNPRFIVPVSPPVVFLPILKSIVTTFVISTPSGKRGTASPARGASRNFPSAPQSGSVASHRSFPPHVHPTAPSHSPSSRQFPFSRQAISADPTALSTAEADWGMMDAAATAVKRTFRLLIDDDVLSLSLLLLCSGCMDSEVVVVCIVTLFGEIMEKPNTAT
mmetsp:Transcript_35081/g.52358  ORF Transcript_35081/g.52358 Transcript_35081/m.52358 type:complete len:210 (+) Transcript_35081:538-1167(+)